MIHFIVSLQKSYSLWIFTGGTAEGDRNPKRRIGQEPKEKLIWLLLYCIVYNQSCSRNHWATTGCVWVNIYTGNVCPGLSSFLPQIRLGTWPGHLPTTSWTAAQSTEDDFFKVYFLPSLKMAEFVEDCNLFIALITYLFHSYGGRVRQTKKQFTKIRPWTSFICLSVCPLQCSYSTYNNSIHGHSYQLFYHKQHPLHSLPIV